MHSGDKDMLKLDFTEQIELSNSYVLAAGIIRRWLPAAGLFGLVFLLLTGAGSQ